MVALNPPVCDFGQAAIDFDLPGTDGRRHTLATCRGPNGLLVMFICNHCPYVKAIIDRLIRDCRELAIHGIGCVAIMSNDITAYPDDAPENMKCWAEELDFPFPYLYDETQSVARAYGAVCTPDFFGYNNQLQLEYRGRLDASGRNPAPPDARRELFEAMCDIARCGQGPSQQTASIGCSIKWNL
ncbi:thioredoxin family protein [Ferribacterium limneticum]|uniref:thioredoxin family protein n=1 Tax=Ferribacterium limneticum TaxID=76259 RepID=UPI001CF9DA71|nr:thioredoxin family protein [Ferribacterium limneticum]UCV27896.1 thioredoxin family protein [Ferribacterium limneticum]UCV31813.1 thioredoxin family protein [Ferribacterium limneticum]